ncbi:MAG: tRNA 4-thiouridine(8) synthase ThiI [Bdellovibrionales bacterium GWA2_49_15]|nr:MAG: tRNA 4-thiouridine(8) synthase ThiI [Bdellovibrionales bacterium GWA2_49_15]HAZ12322.1 tRNA 4-thiouridine(8) synthase ThiI [Bdellovibrionales bacterium]
MQQALLISVDELWLKGKNRDGYFEMMREHLREYFIAEKVGAFTLRNQGQRFLCEFSERFPSIPEQLIRGLRLLPGLHTIIPVECVVERTLEAMFLSAQRSILKMKAKRWPFTFKVETYRSDKKFSMNSMEISRELGHLLLVAFPELKVDVHRPDFLIEVFVESEKILVATEYFRGMGGLPIGTAGHAITLISGGIDSPVASYFMAKRGLAQTFAFFHAYPYVGDEVKEKIIKLIGLLAPSHRKTKLVVIPFGKIQEIIGTHAYPEYRTVLFRLYMLKTAELLADKVEAGALITGDGLGQVSSQTLVNLSVINTLLKLIVLRPLIGLNKIEIIDWAKKIGTYQTSIIPHDDACALFAPKRPTTRANQDYVKEFLLKHPMEDEQKLALSTAQIYTFDVRGKFVKEKNFLFE